MWVKKNLVIGMSKNFVPFFCSGFTQYYVQKPHEFGLLILFEFF